MLRALQLTGLLGLAFMLSGSSANAQYGYPGGYGGYGWGGWGGGGGGGATPQGDYARGMGAFAAGAGYYNEATAEATAINANTAMNWNEYWYQSQQAVNKKYYARMAEKQKANNKAADSAYLRVRDNPNKYDVYRGDALNVIFDELCNPKVYLRGLKSTAITFPGEMIRDVPFQFAQQAVTATVHSVMTKGSAPAILRTDPYKDDLAKLREIGDKIREEDDKEGKLDPETLDEAAATIVKLQGLVAANLKQGTKDRTDADRFLKAALGLSKMLRTPALNVLLADVDKRPSTTVGDLLGFMKAFNLRFGAADDPREKMVYDNLYPILLKLRDEAFPDRKPDMANATEADLEHPAAFFAGMDSKALDHSSVPFPPKPSTDPK